jgi:hypothetical protein
VPSCAPTTLCPTASRVSCPRKYDIMTEEDANTKDCLTDGGEAYCTRGDTNNLCAIEYECVWDDFFKTCVHSGVTSPAAYAPSSCNTTP